jgi:hypothetical protein
MQSKIKFALLVITVALIFFFSGYYFRGIRVNKMPASNDNDIDTQQKTPLSTLDSLRNTAQAFMGDELIPVYGIDDETWKTKIDYYLRIPKNISLEEKLKYYADRLSKIRFRGNPIEILSIDNHGSKLIGIINLREPEDKKSYFWRTGYFQGSSGGTMTTYTLIFSFLQRYYKGEWVDGVEFYYEGKPITNKWDHINLDGVKMRDSIPHEY